LAPRGRARGVGPPTVTTPFGVVKVTASPFFSDLTTTFATSRALSFRVGFAGDFFGRFAGDFFFVGFVDAVGRVGLVFVVFFVGRVGLVFVVFFVGVGFFVGAATRRTGAGRRAALDDLRPVAELRFFF
jgi:hypothetical protein